MNDSGDAETERLSIRGLLEEPVFANGRILSGEGHLDRPVTWCLPWDEVLSRPDSLVEVAVYVRSDALANYRGNLSSLAARGAAVLIIDGVAPENSRWSDEVPVFEIGSPVGFTAMNRLLAERALTQEAHVMRYGVMVHQALVTLLHRGAGLPTLIREVSKLTSNPAVALDVRGDLIAASGLKDSTSQSSVVLLNHLAEALPTRSERPVGHGQDVRVLELGGSPYPLAVAGAMQLAGRHEGWIVVLVGEGKARRHDIAQYSVVAEQAGTIIGTEMLRQRSVDEAEERARGDFVQALVHHNFANQLDLRTRAALHEIDLDLDYMVFVAPGLTPRSHDGPSPSLMRLARYAAGVLPHPDVRSHVTVIGDVLVVIRPIRSDRDLEISEYAEEIARDLEARLGQPIPIAHGRLAHGAVNISESYREARIALGIATRLNLSGSVAYRDLRGFSVLEAASGTEESRRLIADVLEPLRAGNGANDVEEFLFAYLEVGGNLNAAARRLQIHRNTVISKLNRASKVIGMDIRRPENQFIVWLALRLDLLSTVRDNVVREVSPRG
ncbi:helix-turn-helix domain-containing protein [Nocardia sp. NPDC051990]|uniref:helix-turn-helix domain-containing protein n=1 Tax=Nocardia sp. NPDC051990 TaxID=3155285 RepID=UPI00342B4E11